MIKILKTKYECKMCENTLEVSREIVVDEYLKKIELAKPERCKCGCKNKFNLLDVELENGNYKQ